ncbi:hypothetical protein GCM10010411_37230 [Actinomadura fulvescens]|uniref:Uncharacterized protein n=1 Tax=Actinomadura fulvescens TaxID=46160 RepID=A0ABP6C8P6_9ACTN
MGTTTAGMNISDALPYLDELRQKLSDRGFTARVVQARESPPFLRVVNAEAGQLAEDITCAPWGDELSFWWSWNAPICPVRHLESATERVTYVLNAKTATG